MIFCFVFLGFCFGRWGFAAGGLVSGLGWSWAGLVLGWFGPGWVGPRMNWSWNGLFGFCARYTQVFAPSRPGLEVFGPIGFWYQGWADGNARDNGQGTT